MCSTHTQRGHSTLVRRLGTVLSHPVVAAAAECANRSATAPAAVPVITYAVEVLASAAAAHTRWGIPCGGGASRGADPAPPLPPVGPDCAATLLPGSLTVVGREATGAVSPKNRKRKKRPSVNLTFVSANTSIVAVTATRVVRGGGTVNTTLSVGITADNITRAAGADGVDLRCPRLPRRAAGPPSVYARQACQAVASASYLHLPGTGQPGRLHRGEPPGSLPRLRRWRWGRAALSRPSWPSLSALLLSVTQSAAAPPSSTRAAGAQTCSGPRSRR